MGSVATRALATAKTFLETIVSLQEPMPMDFELGAETEWLTPALTQTPTARKRKRPWGGEGRRGTAWKHRKKSKNPATTTERCRYHLKRVSPSPHASGFQGQLESFMTEAMGAIKPTMTHYCESLVEGSTMRGTLHERALRRYLEMQKITTEETPKAHTHSNGVGLYDFVKAGPFQDRKTDGAHVEVKSSRLSDKGNSWEIAFTEIKPSLHQCLYLLLESPTDVLVTRWLGKRTKTITYSSKASKFADALKEVEKQLLDQAEEVTRIRLDDEDFKSIFASKTKTDILNANVPFGTTIERKVRGGVMEALTRAVYDEIWAPYCTIEDAPTKECDFIVRKRNRHEYIWDKQSPGNMNMTQNLKKAVIRAEVKSSLLSWNSSAYWEARWCGIDNRKHDLLILILVLPHKILFYEHAVCSNYPNKKVPQTITRSARTGLKASEDWRVAASQIEESLKKDRSFRKVCDLCIKPTDFDTYSQAYQTICAQRVQQL